MQFGAFTNAAIAQTLARSATQLACGDMQPTPVFRGVTARDASYVRTRTVRCKRFIERSCGVRVEVVANEGV